MDKRTTQFCKNAVSAIICGIMVFSLAACQSNPETSIIKNKDMDKLIEEAQNPGEDDVSMDALVDQYNQYQASIKDEKLGVSVNVDAKVDIPKADKLSILRAEQAPISQEQLNAVRKALIGDAAFYLNKAAFDRLSAASSISSERKSYTINGRASHQARFLLCDSIPGETAAAFHAGTSVSLNTHSADSVRVMYQDSDITELRERELSSAGFSIQNQQDLLKGAYEKELFLKDIMYDAVIIAIALTAGIALLPPRYIDSLKQ